MGNILRQWAQDGDDEADDQTGHESLYPRHFSTIVIISFISKRQNINNNGHNGKKVGINSMICYFFTMPSHEFFKIHPDQGDDNEQDPPFNFNLMQNLIDLIMQTTLLYQHGILILHHEISNPIKTQSPLYRLYKQKRFGRNITSYIIPEVKNV